VIDVSAFLPMERFYQLVESLRDYIKSSKPAEGFEEVLLPGEPEFRTSRARQQNGIPLDDATWLKILRCAESLGVKWRAETPARIPM
jgi:LDH2 family malate/lactate/ureidoglycolate dehydrogenase